MPMRDCGSTTVRTTACVSVTSSTMPTSPCGTVTTMLPSTPSRLPLPSVSRERRVLLLSPVTGEVRATPGDWSAWICSTSVSCATARFRSRFSRSSSWMVRPAAASSRRRSWRSASVARAARRLVPLRCSRLWGSATLAVSAAGGSASRPLTTTVSSPSPRKVNQARSSLDKPYSRSPEQALHGRERQADDVRMAAVHSFDERCPEALQGVTARLVAAFAAGRVVVYFHFGQGPEPYPGDRRFRVRHPGCHKGVAGDNDVFRTGQFPQEAPVVRFIHGFFQEDSVPADYRIGRQHRQAAALPGRGGRL